MLSTPLMHRRNTLGLSICKFPATGCWANVCQQMHHVSYQALDHHILPPKRYESKWLKLDHSRCTSAWHGGGVAYHSMIDGICKPSDEHLVSELWKEQTSINARTLVLSKDLGNERCWAFSTSNAGMQQAVYTKNEVCTA